MRVLVCHNHYQQLGGEDLVFAEEAALLESHGHEVLRYTLHNDAIRRMSHLGLAARVLFNREVYVDLRRRIRHSRPDVMHATNIFPLISPAACRAAHAEGVPVVLSLHNYRLACPNALFWRDGNVCEECLGRTIPWPGVVHGCYRESRPATVVVAAMLGVHRMLKTWTRDVDLYCALTEFARRKFIDAGLPAEKIAVKPNFVASDPGMGNGRGGYFVFVSRLVEEKGVATLLDAWTRLPRNVELKILGDGPMADLVHQAATLDPRITWLGWRGPEEVRAVVGDAAALVMPSIWYETFGRTIIEAFALGTPVIASRLGSMAELVDDGRTGLHFTPGDPNDLAAKIQAFLARPELVPAMRQACRRQYENLYTPERNYCLLMDLYAQASK